MVQSQFSLTWNSYKNSICDGFTSLQQNGELVDMTLAADGHFVKVHQVLLALASPYLKELMISAPCQHPVLFLNNVSYKNMSLILEYIYTGEVLVPAENLTSFAEAARGLHIRGLENLNNECLNFYDGISKQTEETNLGRVSGMKRLAIPTNDGIGQITIPAAAQKVFVKHELLQPNEPVEPPPDASQNIPDFPDMMDDSDDDYKSDNVKSLPTLTPTKNVKVSNLQYTVSIRGSLQVILNRYIYNLQSSPNRMGVRRWRCIEYRNNKCMAFVVTKDNVVLNRANLHNHGFHDKKILAKINKKCIFSAIDDIQDYKEKEDARRADGGNTTDEGFETVDL